MKIGVRTRARDPNAQAGSVSGGQVTTHVQRGLEPVRVGYLVLCLMLLILAAILLPFPFLFVLAIPIAMIAGLAFAAVALSIGRGPEVRMLRNVAAVLMIVMGSVVLVVGVLLTPLGFFGESIYRRVPFRAVLPVSLVVGEEAIWGIRVIPLPLLWLLAPVLITLGVAASAG